jgi:hypothetical protein
VARSGKPAVDRGPDSPPREGWVAFAPVARNEEDKAVARSNRALETAINGLPGRIQAMPMKIDDPVGLDAAARQAAVPSGVERDANITSRRFRDRRGRSSRCLRGRLSDRRYKDMRIILVPG